MVAAQRKRGIDTAAIGYGQDADVAQVGGGTLRFIAGDEIMNEVFGTGLTRATVPIARDELVRVSLRKGTSLRRLWGQVRGAGINWIEYRFATFHSGDYETIILEVDTPKGAATGSHTLLTVAGRYADRAGAGHEILQQDLVVEMVEDKQPIAGYSDSVVLKAAALLEFGSALWPSGGSA